MSAPQASCLLYFDDEAASALRLGQAAGLPALAVSTSKCDYNVVQTYAITWS